MNAALTQGVCMWMLGFQTPNPEQFSQTPNPEQFSQTPNPEQFSKTPRSSHDWLVVVDSERFVVYLMYSYSKKKLTLTRR